MSDPVYAAGGRTVAVHPLEQIVAPMVSGVTAGLTAPGVRTGSGRPTAGERVPVTGSGVGSGPTVVIGADETGEPVGDDPGTVGAPAVEHPAIRTATTHATPMILMSDQSGGNQ
ncbi:MAG: hypothetical protein NVS1B12_10010 [Acidimicrobiales bacterium]